MQSKSFIWVAMSLAFGYLFYEQWAGFNLLLFAALLLLVWYLLYPTAAKQQSWRFVAIGLGISAICLVWTSSTVALIATFISLAVLMGMNLKHQSLLLAFPQAFLNLFAAPIQYVDTFLQAPSNDDIDSSVSKNKATPLRIYTISIGITLFFFALYVQASPIFGAVISQINLSFISWGGVAFTLFGAALLFGCFYPAVYADLLGYEQNQTDHIKAREQNHQQEELTTEYATGRLLFILLNILLSIFIVVEVLYVFVWDMLPTGVNQADFLHQSVHTLIISIVLAIAIILYFFRGQLNFFAPNKLLQTLALVWIALNTVLLFITFYKNFLYIDAFGLTRKRIGVYFYLLLTLIGLVFTYWKVWQIKSNWFLFRMTSWGFYTVLLCASFFRWDSLITNYNLTNKPPYRHIDYNYLIKDLSESNLPELLRMNKENPKLFTQAQQQALAQKKAAFQRNQNLTDWQSWTYEQNRIAQEIE
jgi:hypothetical protein